MPVWETKSIEDQPEIYMSRWLVFRVFVQERKPTDHIIGYADGEGRVSSKIVDFDKERATATTQTGRKYFLPPENDGMNQDAMYVFGVWKDRIENFVKDENVTHLYYVEDPVDDDIMDQLEEDIPEIPDIVENPDIVKPDPEPEVEVVQEKTEDGSDTPKPRRRRRSDRSGNGT